ncbi:MAG: imidazole glycerol phosphate synthase subunit HisH [Candidatus Eisenbacteria bacterium]|nr:imidazole glycerol phosphate synthase subunit HisH [Candidatus Eisenbacteria bacterium]
MNIVVDYGVGNLGAIINMLEHLGHDAVASRDPRSIVSAARLILPGVGAFDQAMARLRELDLVAPLTEAVVARGAPVLGICLGMQLLGRSSDEGQRSERGLGWIPADVVKLSPHEGVKVPHMGWSEVSPTRASALFPGGNEVPRYYFSHSYCLEPDDDRDIAARCDYGGTFAAAVARGSVFGVQFHPEKSHRHGMALLQRFMELT